MARFSKSVFGGLAAAALLAQGALAAPIWTESVDGDLSNNWLAPTPLAASVGSNTVSGTTVSGDRDYFSIVVPGEPRSTRSC